MTPKDLVHQYGDAQRKLLVDAIRANVAAFQEAPARDEVVAGLVAMLLADGAELANAARIPCRAFSALAAKAWAEASRARGKDAPRKLAAAREALVEDAGVSRRRRSRSCP